MPSGLALKAVAEDPRLSASRSLLAVTASGFDGHIPAPMVPVVLAELAMADVTDLLPALIPLAQAYADPPISRYRVGVIAEGMSGALYVGMNIEQPHSPLSRTIHGEQSAVVNAWDHGETGLRRLAVSAPPCGHCRQFLYETNGAPQMEILIAGRPPTTLSDLLPSAFWPITLGVAVALMAPQSAPLALRGGAPAPGELAAHAIAAAQASYAPYSKAYAALALQTPTGIVAGRYAENAAFNPSLGPMPAALALLRLHGQAITDVTAAALAYADDTAIDHATEVRAILADLPTTVVPQLIQLRRPPQLGGTGPGVSL